MIYSYLLQSNAWAASAVRRFLSIQHSTGGRGVYGALFLMLVLGAAVLAPGQALHAQEAAPAAQMTTVNINSADAPALAAALKGVGQSRAQEIVRYREAYGPFASAEELTEVKGIGQSTLDKNRKVITLE